MTGGDEPKPVIGLQMVIDFAKLREIARKGVSRAAAFLSVGLSVTENYVPASLALEKDSMWRFFPEPVPEQIGKEAVREFRFWLVGNALRELDLHFSLFLDSTWAMLAWSKLHRTRVSSAYTVKQISGETNAAKKFSMLMRELGDAKPDTSMLWSLSNARNCLTHNVGVVIPRYANSDQTLLIRWIGFEARLQQGEQYIVMPPVMDMLQAPDPSKEADVVLAVVEREKRFAAGEKIELTPGELHEICFYYLRLTDQVMERFSADLAARGIGPALLSPVPQQQPQQSQ
jgi:hypothetical protein